MQHIITTTEFRLKKNNGLILPIGKFKLSNYQTINIPKLSFYKHLYYLANFTIPR
jgi:hypothetical protein